MITVTIHQAKTHLSRLVREVQHGEAVLILHGSTPVARLVPADTTTPQRPGIGQPTAAGVSWTDDAFRPLTDDELKEWGL